MPDTTRVVVIDDRVAFGDGRLGLIAGPCVVESTDHVLRMAEAIAERARAHGLPYVFKASFDKANRTSGSSFRGHGFDEGLRALAAVREKIGVPVVTDVHDVGQVAAVADAVDIVQIPAFLCRQTDLVEAAAGCGRVVNLKKGQFLAPWDMKHVVDKAADKGNHRILVTERGASFGYNNLVVDFKGLGVLAELGYPVVLDVTHSLQLPAAASGQTGGERRFAPALAAAGVAAGVDVLFLEVHDDSDRALSDAATQWPLERLDTLLDRVTRVHAARGPDDFTAGNET